MARQKSATLSFRAPHLWLLPTTGWRQIMVGAAEKSAASGATLSLRSAPWPGARRFRREVVVVTKRLGYLGIPPATTQMFRIGKQRGAREYYTKGTVTTVKYQTSSRTYLWLLTTHASGLRSARTLLAPASTVLPYPALPSACQILATSALWSQESTPT